MNLAKDPIPFLVRRIAFPASVGWFFNTMFNVVDTFWAGQLSAQAIAALSLSMIPFLGLLSLGIGLGQGTNALVSNALGAQQNERAVRLIAQALLLALVASGLVMLLGRLSLPYSIAIWAQKSHIWRWPSTTSTGLFMGAPLSSSI